MATNPYELLGVTRDASQDDIQKAYRKLAKKVHPDLNPGNKKAEEQFKEIASTYSLLADVDRRKKLDAGEINESGAERPRQNYYRDFAETEAEDPYAHGGNFGGDDDLMAEFFGGGGAEFRMQGHVAHYRLPVDFLSAIKRD